MMDRRKFLINSAAVAPLGSFPLVLDAPNKTDPIDQIKHHAEEVMNVLRATAPKEFKPPTGFAVVGNGILAHAFCEDYKMGDMFAKFDSHSGGWKIDP